MAKASLEKGPCGGLREGSVRQNAALRPTKIGLGGYPLVTLARARSAALANARVAKAGGDLRKRKRGVVRRPPDHINRLVLRQAQIYGYLRFFLAPDSFPRLKPVFLRGEAYPLALPG